MANEKIDAALRSVDEALADEQLADRPTLAHTRRLLDRVRGRNERGGDSYRQIAARHITALDDETR